MIYRIIGLPRYMQPVIIIGVGGRSAAGKSEITIEIEKRFGGRVPIISQDWYYKSLEDKSLGPSHNWDVPDSFNKELILQSLRRWKAGESVWTPRHDYANYEQLENQEKINSAPVMIFEGILAFEDPEIAELLDLKIYVECDEDVALGRRINRDVTDRGYDIRLICERYFSHVKPAFERYILPMKKRADIIIPNNGSTGVSNTKSIDIIVTYIRGMLAGV